MQAGNEAAIIDDRSNRGGQFARDIVESPRRIPMSAITFREGADWMQPQGAVFGPKAMLANELAISGGDLMAWYFKRFGVGKSIGLRTMDGLFRIDGNLVPAPMDGGAETPPTNAKWRTIPFRPWHRPPIAPAAGIAGNRRLLRAQPRLG